MAIYDEIKDFDFFGDEGDDESPQAAVQPLEEEALQDSYSPAIVPASAPELRSSGWTAPIQMAPVGNVPGIERVSSIPRPETKAGMIPEEPLSFTNLIPEEPWKTAPQPVVPEDLTKFESAKVETPESYEAKIQQQKGLDIDALSQEIKMSMAKEPTGITADDMNRLMRESTDFFGETPKTQRSLDTLYRPSYEETVPIGKETPGEVDRDPTFLEEIMRAPVRGIVQIADVGAGLAGLAGSTLRIDALTKAGMKIQESLAPILEKYKSGVESLSDIKGAGDAITYATNAVLENIPFMVASFGTGAIVKGVLTKGVAMGLGKSTMRNIAKDAADKAVKDYLASGLATTRKGLGAIASAGARAGTERALGAAGQTIASIGMETGVIAADRMREGIDPVSLNLLWAVPAGFLDSFTNWKFAERLGLMGKQITNSFEKGGKEEAKSTWRKVMKEFASGFKSEAPTEAMQEALEQFGTGNYKVDQQLLTRMVNAGIQGGLAGGFMSMGITAFEQPNKITVDEATGQVARPFILPKHAQFATIVDKWMGSLGPTAAPGTPPVIDPTTGQPIVNLTEAKVPWYNEVVALDIRQPSDILRLSPEAQESFNNFWNANKPEGDAKDFPSFFNLYYQGLGITPGGKKTSIKEPDLTYTPPAREPQKLEEFTFLPGEGEKAPEVKEYEPPPPEPFKPETDRPMTADEILEAKKLAPKKEPRTGMEMYPEGEAALPAVQEEEDLYTLFNRMVHGKQDPKFMENMMGRLVDRLAFVERDDRRRVDQFFDDGAIIDGNFVLRTITNGHLLTHYDPQATNKDKPFSVVKYTKNGKDYYGKQMIDVLMKDIQEYLVVRDYFLGDQRTDLLPGPPPGTQEGTPGVENLPARRTAPRSTLEKMAFYRDLLRKIAKEKERIKREKEAREVNKEYVDVEYTDVTPQDVANEDKYSRELKLLEDKYLRGQKPQRKMGAAEAALLQESAEAEAEAERRLKAGKVFGAGLEKEGPPTKKRGAIKVESRENIEPSSPWLLKDPPYTRVAIRVGEDPRMTFQMALDTWNEQKTISKKSEDMEEVNRKQYLREVVYAFINKDLGLEPGSLREQDVEQYFAAPARATKTRGAISPVSKSVREMGGRKAQFLVEFYDGRPPIVRDGISEYQVKKDLAAAGITGVQRLTPVKVTGSVKGEPNIVPTFYSQASKVIEQKMPNAATSEDVLNMLSAVVKAEEMKWSGLDDYLRGRAGQKVTKKEVLDFLRANDVEIREVMRGEGKLPPDEAAEMQALEDKLNGHGPRLTQKEVDRYNFLDRKLRRSMQPARYGAYVLPGGENYRELLLTLPLTFGAKNIKDVPGFSSSHWAETNVLAHVRFDERTDADGKRVLFIEEVQSDWHQAGREKGYRPDNKDFRFEEMKQGDMTLYAAYIGNTQYSEFFPTKEQALADVKNSNVVPQAPFSKTWHELVMKRMLRWAAENGYDSVAWTTGEQQAERYDLSKQIDSIDWFVKPNGTYKLKAWAGGNLLVEKERIGPDELEGIVGKDLAQKIINRAKGEPVDGGGRISGVDLKVGGEGMKGFYDKILVDFMNKYGKKWGAKVGETTLDTTHEVVTGAGVRQITKNVLKVVHSMDITPSMKQSVLYEGQPKFRFSEKLQRTVMTKTQADKAVKDFMFKIPAGILDVKVYENFDELTDAEKKQLKGFERARAAYVQRKDGATIYVFANKHSSGIDIKRSLFHETISHFGFENMFGPVRLQWIGEAVHKTYGMPEMKHIYEAYGLNPFDPTDRHIAGMEKISEISETLENPGLWKRFVAWFREQVRDILGFDLKLTEDEIRAYLWRSRNIIMSQRTKTEAEAYNNLRQRLGFEYKPTLPLGPLKIAGSIEANVNHDNPAANEMGWNNYWKARGQRAQNWTKQVDGEFVETDFVKDLGKGMAFAGLPFWIGEDHPAFKDVLNVEWERANKRNRDRLYLLRNPDTNTGDNPYAALKDTKGVDKMLIWSDQNETYLATEDELQAQAKKTVGRKLSAEEVTAYYAWKKAFDRAAEYAVEKLRQTARNLYVDKSWNGLLQDYLQKKDITQGVAALSPEDRSDLNNAALLTDERLANAAALEKKLKSMAFYVPHIRGKGPYAVRVYVTDNTTIDKKTGKPRQVVVWAERFDSTTKAEQARIRLQRDFPDATVAKIQDNKIDEFIYGALSVPQMEAFLSQVAEKIKQEGKVAPEVADKLFQSVYDHMEELSMARGFRAHYIKRHRPEVIKGYQTENLKEVFLDYMSGLAGSMTKLEASFDFHKALRKMTKSAKPELFQYAVRYVDDMLRNTDQLDRRMSGLKAIPYAWYLSMNLRLAATQGFQNLITAYPILARLQQENGIKGPAWARLGKAMSDYATNSISQEERQMLLDAHDEGEDMASAIKEMKGRMQGGWAKKHLQKVIDAVSIPFAYMETFNRKTSLLAAFRMYRQAGKSVEESYDGAKDFVRMAHYAYGLSNYPQLLRDGTPFSKIAGMAYVFKSFPHNYVLSMMHFAKDKEGKAALGVLMRSVAMIFLLGGMAALPFVDDMLEAYEKLSGHPVRAEVRNTLKKYGPDWLASAGIEGIPTLAGVDMSGSVKLALPVPGLGFDPGTFTMGVWGGLIDKGVKTLGYAVDGELGRTLESAAPVGMELMIKSLRQKKEGLRTAQERPILGAEGKPIVPTAYQTGLQMAGFRPHAISEVQKERRSMQNIQEKYSKERQEIRRELRTASAQGDIAALENIRKKIQKYNMSVMKYKGVVPRFGGIKETFKPETGYMKSRRLFQENEEE